MLRRACLRLARPTTDGKSVSEIVRAHCYKPWTPQKGWNPAHIVSAEGCYMTTDSGKKILDLSSNLVCTTLGYNNKEVSDAMVKQAQTLPFVGCALATTPRAELCTELLKVCPPGIEKFFFPTSGAQAVECALKVARMYTGREKIISRYNAYHGATTACIGITSEFRRYYSEKFRLMSREGLICIPEYNPYRPGPLGAEASAHAEYLDYVLTNEPNTAALIMEAIPGSNGCMMPSNDYWPKMAEVCKKHGVLLIDDEVMSAWGRAGEWFAVDKWGIQPDIVTTAKGITNAQAPLGLMGTSAAIAQHFEENWFCNGHTYEAHPMTLAPAVAAIGVFHKQKLIERARVKGAEFGAKLQGLKERHPSVGDVRGTGFFWAIELVKNRETKEPFFTNAKKLAGEASPIDAVAGHLLNKHGVFTFAHLNHFMCTPPIIISDEEVDYAIKALDDALLITDKLVQ